MALSSAYKNLATDLIKITNDLRLLGSGPQAGLHELELPKVQAGSSIMPGKVNPVIPEVCAQVAFQVVGNDAAIALASSSGQLELNAFEPVMFDDLLKTHPFFAARSYFEEKLPRSSQSQRATLR